MPISFECSDCGTALKVKDQLSGRKIKCPHCEAVNRVPAENEESDEDEDDDFASRKRSPATSSRSKPSRRSQPRRSRADDDDESEELPQPSRRKKKKTSRKSGSGSGGKLPTWAIFAGSGLAGVLIIAVIVFVVMKPRAPGANAQAAGGDAKPAEQPKVVQAQVNGPGAKFRMKFEMPAGWTSEGSIEDEMFPWATMNGDGQSIKLSSNRSLLGGAESMTTVGGADERLKASHTSRGAKLQSENTDWVDTAPVVHEGKEGAVVWSDYEYKGVFGKGYGIRCTVAGPVQPCTLMFECSQSARDKWRPILLKIAESIYFVELKENGEEEERDEREIAPADQAPNGDPAANGNPAPNGDPAEMDGDSDE